MSQLIEQPMAIAQSRECLQIATKQAGNAMKKAEFTHQPLLLGSLSDRVLKCLQGAAPCYMTQAEIADATGYGAKAIAWAVFLLWRKGLIKGRRRGECLEYLATPAKDMAPIPKSMKTVRLGQGFELLPVPEVSIADECVKPNPVGTPRLQQGLDRSAIPEGPCGAKTRAGIPCKQKTVYWNGRCKFHGGLSTGPTTAAGKEQARINGRKGGRPRKHAINPTSP
jgi:hypothetical protein